MTSGSCPRTTALEDDLRRDEASEEALSHAEGCEACSALLLSHDLLRQLDESTGVPVELGEPEALWWRSRVLRRLSLEQKREEWRPTSILALLASAAPLLASLAAVSWACFRYLPDLDPRLVPAAVFGAILVTTPVLAWLSLWLADEVTSAS